MLTEPTSFSKHIYQYFETSPNAESSPSLNPLPIHRAAVPHLSVINALFENNWLTSIGGKLIAIRSLMIFTTIQMKVFPEKRKELFQTLKSLVSSIKKQKGCRRCEFCVSAEDENEFCLFGEWESKEALASHLESNLFKVLLGAMSLLKNPHEMNLYTDASKPDSPVLPESVAIS